MKRLMDFIRCALLIAGFALTPVAYAVTNADIAGVWVFESSDAGDDASNLELNFEFRRDSVFRLNILDDPDCAPFFIEGAYALSGDYKGLSLLGMVLTGITCGPDSLDLTEYADPEDLGIGVFAVGIFSGKLAIYDFESETTDILTRSTVLPTTPKFQPFSFGSDAISADQLRVNARPAKGSQERDLVVELDLRTAAAAPGFAAATGYKVYVAAMVPGEAVGTPGRPQWFVRQRQGAGQPWTALSFPLPAFMDNVQVGSADARLRLEVINDTNLGSLRGTEFYIGYGVDENEMMRAGRVRGFYKVR